MGISRNIKWAAYIHDKKYDKLGDAGLWAVASDTRTIGADWSFVWQEMQVASMSSGWDAWSQLTAISSATFIGVVALPKTLWQVTQPYGFSTIYYWNNYTNK